MEFLSEGPEVIGNDYAIDDISFNEILIPEFIPVKTVDFPTANDGLSFVPNSVIVNDTTDPNADPNVGFSLPDVLGGETVTVIFQAQAEEIPVPNPALNSANIRYSYTPVEGGIPGEYNVTTNEVPVEVGTLADISVLKTASPSPVEPEGELIYAITVSNAGPSPAINTILTDDIPSELTNVEFSMDGGITFLPWSSSYTLGTLDAGASRIILIRGTVNALASGQIVNTAVVRSDTPDPDPDNNTSTVITPVIPAENSADLSIKKTSAPNPVQPGSMLTYTLTIANAGPDASQNVILTDHVPSALADVEFSLNGGAAWQPWTGTYNLGTLNEGSSITVLIRGIADPSFSGSIVNTSTVSSGTPDPDPCNNTAVNTTNIAPLADITVTKSGQPATAAQGELVTYTITVRNQGPEAAENVILYDQAPLNSPECNFPQTTVQRGTPGSIPIFWARLKAARAG